MPIALKELQERVAVETTTRVPAGPAAAAAAVP
jgi:hypothetical protein